jgi:DNA-binding LacI/PurR family transcriptional regulator
MRVSLRLIAEQAGVNPATVSRALRGLHCVDPSTRERITQLAKKLGYIRDPMLSNALSFARRSDKPVYRETLAFLAIAEPSAFKELPWLNQMYHGGLDRAKELGYAVECHHLPSTTSDQKALSRQLRARGIRGCIVCPVSPQTEWTPISLNFDWDHLTGVQIGHALIYPTLPAITRNLPDDLSAMFDHLHRLGYRRIGLAVSRHGEETRRWAILSALLLFQTFHPKIHISALFQDEKDFTALAFGRWLRKRKPDVVIVNGPGVLEWIDETPIRVPQDIGVCRIDCQTGCRESGLQTNYLNMGRMAANQLIPILEHGTPLSCDPTGTNLLLSLSSEWHNGQTLRSAF